MLAGVMPKFSRYYSLLSCSNRSGFRVYLVPWAICSRLIHRSSILPECSRSCSSSLLHSCFTSSSFSSTSFLRSRDEISCQWRRVVTPRVRCAWCLPVIRCCCHVICLCVVLVTPSMRLYLPRVEARLRGITALRALQVGNQSLPRP